MTSSFYKLQVLSQAPEEFPGKVFSFNSYPGAICIDLESDPFLSVKKAAIEAIGSPCALITEGPCFFSELFVSLYEQLSMMHLEIKEWFLPQTRAFLEKKGFKFHYADFQNGQKQKTILIGKGACLLDDLEKIKAYQNNCLIVASYSSLPTLEKEGICADIALAFDSSQTVHTSKNAKILLVSCKTSAKILEGFPNLSLFPESYCSFSNYLYAKHPHPPIYGYTVIDTCLKYLIQSGLKEFYLSGVSLEEFGGVYADLTECGYKPDFKKAKEHLESLKQQHGGIFELSNLVIDPSKDIKIMPELHPFEVDSIIEEFDVSLKQILNADVASMGLYEMFMFEQSPFYQVVLEPLYNKWSVLQSDQSQEKRPFFETVINRYSKDFL